MKLVPYIPCCYDPEWPLATARLRIQHATQHSSGVDLVETSECDLIFALPPWTVHDWAIREELLDETGVVIHNDQTADLFAGWTECDTTDIIQVLSIRPVITSS
jgi:hypothetical protein